jgi:hypothetical protein
MQAALIGSGFGYFVARASLTGSRWRKAADRGWQLLTGPGYSRTAASGPKGTRCA